MKLHLRLSEFDSAEQALAALDGAAVRHAALGADLSNLSNLVRSMDSSGREVLRAGGNFHSTRETKGDGYAVTVEAQFGKGAKEGFFMRLLRR